MAEMWEKLRGKIYPDTEAEQLAALETDETVRDYKKRREAWASDPYRPIYHMSSLYGMGDANGLCEWQGRYHLFYQFGPPDVNRVHWGHWLQRRFGALARSTLGIVSRYRTALL